MKKTFPSPVVLIIVWALLTGMSGRSGLEVPIPEAKFNATVIDDQEVSTKCRSVSWEGETYLKATRGKGIVTIAFEKIKKVTYVGEGRGGKTDFQVTLRSGEVVAVSLEGEDRFYGTTSFGTFRIKARNIEEIIFE